MIFKKPFLVCGQCSKIVERKGSRHWYCAPCQKLIKMEKERIRNLANYHKAVAAGTLKIDVELKRQRCRAHYLKNRQMVSEKNKLYRLKNKEKASEYQKKYKRKYRIAYHLLKEAGFDFEGL